MNRYGDSRMYMEELMHAMVERAKEVGPRMAVAEVLEVVQDFTDPTNYYWEEQEESQP